MPLATLFDEALLATLNTTFEAVPPGVIMAGMPAEPVGWLPRLVAALQQDERYYISVVGADAALRATLPTALPDDLHFELGATHAVKVRNQASLQDTVRRVVIMLRPESRLHSLRQRGYLTLGPADVVRHLAQRQANEPIPQPQQQLWHCLAEGRPPVALLAFLDFYQAVTLVGTAASPRDELYRLGLLPDPSLLDATKQKSVADRLAENADLMQKFLLGDPAHEETAYKQYQAATALDAQLAERLLAAFAALRAIDPAEPLPPQLLHFKLNLPLVRQLLGGPLQATGTITAATSEPVGPPVAAEPESDFPDPDNPGGSSDDPDNPGGNTDPDEDEEPEEFAPVSGGRSGEASGQRPGPSPKKKYNFGLDDAVVHLAAGEVAGLLGGWQATATKLLDKLRTRLHKTPEETKPLEAGRVQVLHHTNAVALDLTNTLLGAEQLGGVLTLSHLSTVEEALGSLTADQLPPAAPAWDAAWLAELRRYLRTADGLVSGLAGEAALTTYLATRAALLPSATLLTSAPLSALVLDSALQAAATQAVAAYNHLLHTVAGHYPELQRHNSAGQRIASLLLRLDVVEVRAGTTHRAALLSPLHPLALWKYLELARLLLDGPEQASTLLHIFADRRELLREPLRALVLPLDGSFPTVALAQAERLGAAWPVYRPTGLVRVTVSEKILTQAARKLAVLYPAIHRCLRVFVQHPEHLEAVAEALEELRHETKYDRVRYERFEVLIGFLPGQPVSLQPLDRLLNEGLLTVETRFTESVADVSEWLREQPVHLLVLAGQRHLHPLPIGREATHLHPLSLPQVLEYDQFDPANPLVLRPRGQQPSPDDEAHNRPFAAFHTLAAEVAGQPGREWSGCRSKPAPDGTQPALLPLTVFLLLSAEIPTSADPDHVLVLARQGGLGGDAVLTRWNQRYVKGVREAVLDGLNYDKNVDATKLLRRLEATGHINLLRAISASKAAKNGFLPSDLTGQFSLAVALRWYEDQALNDFHLTISLDSILASRWLDQREDSKRPDLLGIRRSIDSGNLIFDLIEVKSSGMATNLEAAEQPGPQLRAAARALLPILTQTGGDLLTDCRRELLREQIFHEGKLSLPLGVAPAEWATWVNQISTALDGKSTPEINLRLIEVVKGEYFDPDPQESFWPGNATDETLAEQIGIRRTKLGENNIQKYLKNPPSANPGANGPVPPPTPPAYPPAPAGPSAPVLAAAPEAGTPAKVVPDRVSPTPARAAVPATEPTPDEPTDSADSGGMASAASAVPVLTKPANLAQMAGDLYATLRDFNIRLARPIDPALADTGPSLVRFKVELARGQSDRPVRGLASDIQRGMRLHFLPRIENLPGTQFLFVEVPRAEPQVVPLLPLLAHEARQPVRPIGSFPAGMAPDGSIRWLNLLEVRHMLVGGSSGSGKSMFLNALIVSLTELQPAARLHLILIDPKGAEFAFFKHLPHLRTPIIREPAPAIETLEALMAGEYIRRRDLLEQYQCLNIQDYYKLQPPETMPLIAVVVDELETFLGAMNKPDRATFENLLGSIARLTRYVGIHLVVATQRPDSKVIYGNLKNNLDCRVAFKLASNVDSRVVLNEGGAENLMKKGDMLLQVDGHLQRLQGFFLPTEELRNLMTLP
jgi:hypothetical protein